MVWKTRIGMTVWAGALGMVCPAMGQSTHERLEWMQAEMAELQAEMAAMREAQQDESDVEGDRLDAATDAAQANALERMSEAINAGHDGSHFYLNDPGGAFSMEIDGQLQFRYVYNHRENTGEDDNFDGFTLRRTKVGFSGHVTHDERFTYALVLAGDDDGGDLGIEDAIIGYAFTDELELSLGQFKLPFARQELMSSKRQLAMDRSVVHEFFTLDRAQQINLRYTGFENISLSGSLSDGADNENSNFDDEGSDNADVALTGRVDWTVFGDPDTAGDNVAWRGDEPALFLGAAGHIDIGRSGGDDLNYHAYTVDGLYKAAGFSVLSAFYALHTDGEDFVADTDDFGILAEAGYNFDDHWQPFVRYNFIDLDGGGEINAVAAGVNYYFKKHKAKFTIDGIYFLDPLVTPARFPNNPGSGIGVLDDAPGEDGQFALRAQFQLLF